MIIDSSVVIAILRSEPERETFLTIITSDLSGVISAANLLESAIVIDGNRSPELSRALDNFIEDFQINVSDVTESQIRIARAAYRDYGKGSGHRAKLNFGDCFSYALAIEKNEPLLFKGDDFNHTDVLRIAIPQP